MEGAGGAVATGAEAAQGIDTGAEGTVETGMDIVNPGEESGDPEGDYWDSFNMTEGEEEGEAEEETAEEDYKVEALDGLLQAMQLSEEDMAEVQAEMIEHSNFAKDIGLTSEQFNSVVMKFLEMQTSGMLSNIRAAEAGDQDSLSSLQKELTREEKLSWKPTGRMLAEKYGVDVAKAVTFNPGVYRAFLEASQGGAEVAVRKAPPAPKMDYEQALDNYTRDLQDALGNEEKVNLVLDKYSKEYPQFFKK